jgi:hypothetical protein
LTGADEVGVLLGAEITRLIRFGADGSGTVTAAWRRTGDSVPGRSRIAIDDIVAAPVRESGIPARITEQSPPELAPGSCSAVGAPYQGRRQRGLHGRIHRAGRYRDRERPGPSRSRRVSGLPAVGGNLQPRAIWLDPASATQADPPVLLLDEP